MVQNQGIDVYLAPFSDLTKPYLQHSVPRASPNFTGDPNEVYIEAVDGERFGVVLGLMKDFSMYGAEHLYVQWEVDQDRGASRRVSHYTLPELEGGKPRGSALKGRCTYKTITRKTDGVWMQCGFAFAPLNIDESLDMSAEEISNDADMFGKVTVSVQRGHRVVGQCSETGFGGPWDPYDAPDTKISSKQVIKDNRVSHTVSHVIVSEGTQQVLSGRRYGSTWTALKGNPGKQMKFTIRYRFRDVLQKLKIIPADIDPNPIDLVSSSASSSRPSKRIKLEPQSDSDHPLNAQRTFVDRPMSPIIKREPQSSTAHNPLNFQRTVASPAGGLVIRQREPQGAVIEPPDHSHAGLGPPEFIRRVTGETYPPNAQIHNPLPLRHRAPTGPRTTRRRAAPIGLAYNEPSRRIVVDTDLVRSRLEALKEERRKRTTLDEPDA